MTAPLAQKLTLPSGTVLPNRIAKAAMSEQLALRTGAPAQTMIDLYRRRTARPPHRAGLTRQQ